MHSFFGLAKPVTRNYSSASSLTQYIDDVSTVAAVPEPGTALPLGLGLLTLVGARSRRPRYR